jgi:hypothetical protein
MTTHSYHPDTHTHGLADDCPRCAEHAYHPIHSLDPENLAALRYRIKHGLEPRSQNEAIAMLKLTPGSADTSRKPENGPGAPTQAPPAQTHHRGDL